MVLPQGVEYEALDDEPVNLIFLIAAPEGAGNVHITILSKLSMMLMDDTFTESLRKAKSVEEFLNIIDAAETERMMQMLQRKKRQPRRILQQIKRKTIRN